jgi:hypothetical protein
MGYQPLALMPCETNLTENQRRFLRLNTGFCDKAALLCNLNLV